MDIASSVHGSRSHGNRQKRTISGWALPPRSWMPSLSSGKVLCSVSCVWKCSVGHGGSPPTLRREPTCLFERSFPDIHECQHCREHRLAHVSVGADVGATREEKRLPVYYERHQIGI